MKNIFPAFYFGPINYFSELLKSETFDIESYENFQKQSFRNRLVILSANGILKLSIPIVHDGHRIIKDIKPSYDYDWQSEHIKSLRSAYRSSPYFEYYEDGLLEIFNRKEKFLLDLNVKTINFIQSKLKLDFKFKFTDQYQNIEKTVDYRKIYNAKKDNEILLPNYQQVFDNKFGFTSNLSILDLLFNEGPSSSIYLKNLN